MAAVPRSRRRRHRRRRDAARLVVDDRARRLDRRPARPRLVVADRLGRPRVRHLRGEHECVQGAVDGHLRQRLRRRAREAGLAGGRNRQEAGRARHRAGERVGHDQLRRRGARREDRHGRLAARGAPRPAAGRPPSQEHVCVRDAGHRRRAPLRVVRRQRRRVLLHPRRHAALVAHLAAAADLPGLRHGVVAGRPRRPRLSAARQRRRVVPGRARREDRARDLARRPHRSRLPARVGLGDAADLDQRSAHRDRDHRPRLRDQLRPRRPRAVAHEGLPPVDAEPDRRGRPALRRLRIARRSESSAVRGAARCGRRHHAEGGRDVERRGRLVAAARSPATRRRRWRIAAGSMR